jgi:hypothetical protein
MVSGMRVLSWSAVLLSAVAASTASAATKCENLATLELPDVTSITAKSFPGGTFQPPDPTGFVPTPQPISRYGFRFPAHGPTGSKVLGAAGTPARLPGPGSLPQSREVTRRPPPIPAILLSRRAMGWGVVDSR